MQRRTWATSCTSKAPCLVPQSRRDFLFLALVFCQLTCEPNFIRVIYFISFPSKISVGTAFFAPADSSPLLDGNKTFKDSCCPLTTLLLSFQANPASHCSPASQALPHQNCQVHFYPRLRSSAGTGVKFSFQWKIISWWFIAKINTWSKGWWGCWDCSCCDRWPFSHWRNGGEYGCFLLFKGVLQM